MWIKNIAYILFCAAAGGAVAAGYVAFITLLGVFEKLTEKYKASSYLKQVEVSIIAGVTLGNLIQLLQISIPLYNPGFIFFNYWGGLFTGCLAGAIAETLGTLPILSQRFNARNILPYLVLAAALGKGIGSALESLFL